MKNQGLNLTQKILLLFVPVILVSVTVTSLIFLGEFNKSLKEEMSDRLRLMSSLGASDLVNPLYGSNVDEIGKIAQGFSASPHVSQVLVLDKDKNILSDGTPENLKLYETYSGDVPKGDRDVLTETPDSLVMITPIQVGGQLMGFLEISLSLEILRAKEFSLVLLTIGILAGGILAALGSALFLRNTLRPLGSIIASTKSLAEGEGDLSLQIPVLTRDEIGILARNFNGFLGKMRTMIVELKAHSNVLAGSSQELGSSLSENTASIQEITASIKMAAGNVQKQKDMMETSLSEVEVTINALQKIGALTQDAKQKVFTSSTAIEQMAGNIASTGEMSRSGDAAADQLAHSAEDGYASLGELFQSLQELSLSSDRIQEMVALIMGISSQTNLLAMNAAIEAAHAGEAGKGFAVVAEEIRKLADQSSSGAKEIESAVKKIVDGIKQGIELGHDATESFEGIQKSVRSVKELSHQIAASMEEQEKANSQILENVSSLQELSETIATTTNEEAKRGDTIRRALRDLQSLSSEIVQATQEETVAMEETSKSSILVQDVSIKVREVAEGLAREADRFKT